MWVHPHGSLLGLDHESSAGELFARNLIIERVRAGMRRVGSYWPLTAVMWPEAYVSRTVGGLSVFLVRGGASALLAGRFRSVVEYGRQIAARDGDSSDYDQQS